MGRRVQKVSTPLVLDYHTITTPVIPVRLTNTCLFSYSISLYFTLQIRSQAGYGEREERRGAAPFEDGAARAR